MTVSPTATGALRLAAKQPRGLWPVLRPECGQAAAGGLRHDGHRCVVQWHLARPTTGTCLVALPGLTPDHVGGGGAAKCVVKPDSGPEVDGLLLLLHDGQEEPRVVPRCVRQIQADGDCGAHHLGLWQRHLREVQGNEGVHPELLHRRHSVPRYRQALRPCLPRVSGNSAAIMAFIVTLLKLNYVLSGVILSATVTFCI